MLHSPSGDFTLVKTKRKKYDLTDCGFINAKVCKSEFSEEVFKTLMTSRMTTIGSQGYFDLLFSICIFIQI